MTATSPRSGCSTLSATRSASSPPSAIAASPRSSGMISALPSPAWCALRARHFPRRGHDERALPRRRLCRLPAQPPPCRARPASHPARPRGAAARASIISGIMRPRGQCRHARAARRACTHFLRAYYHVKSADWARKPAVRLASWAATELARMPTYYIMDHDRTMPQTVAPYMPAPPRSPPVLAARARELAVYVGEYAHGLSGRPELVSLRDRWTPGMPTSDCSPAARSTSVVLHRRATGLGHLSGAGRVRTHAVGGLHTHARLPSDRGAGHWVQQEQPEEVVTLLLQFLDAT